MKQHIGLVLLAMVALLGIVFIGTQFSDEIGGMLGGANPYATRKTAETANEAKRIEGFSGAVIAGNASPYLDFNKADYDKALSSGKVVFLNFYATWCPICRAEVPDMTAGFNELTTDQVIGFRVNYNDPDTDDDEKALAQQFGIPYQHTKVILKNGQEVLKETKQWSKEELTQQLTTAVAN